MQSMHEASNQMESIIYIYFFKIKIVYILDFNLMETSLGRAHGNNIKKMRLMELKCEIIQSPEIVDFKIFLREEKHLKKNLSQLNSNVKSRKKRFKYKCNVISNEKKYQQHLYIHEVFNYKNK